MGDKRPDCRNGMGCHQKNPEHKMWFQHPPSWNPGPETQNLKKDEPSMSSFYGHGSSSDYSGGSEKSEAQSEYQRMLKDKARQSGLTSKVQAAVDAATKACGGGGFGSSREPSRESIPDPNDRRPECKHGVTCHQKNPEHKVMFKHPPGWVSGSGGAGSEPAATWIKTDGGKLDHRPDCRNGAGCSQPNPEHKTMFKHPPGWDPSHPARDGMDRRQLCKYGVDCKQRNPEHQTMFKHPTGWTPDNTSTDNSYSATSYYQEQLRQYQHQYPGYDPAGMVQYPVSGGGGSNSNNGSNSGYDAASYQQQWAQWQQWQEYYQHQQNTTSNSTSVMPAQPPVPGDTRISTTPETNDTRPPCKFGDDCTNTENDHQVMFWHPEASGPGGMTRGAAMEYYKKNADYMPEEYKTALNGGKVDKRPWCRYEKGCKHRNPEHQQMFQHPPGWTPPPPLPESEPAPPGLEDEPIIRKSSIDGKKRATEEDTNGEDSKKKAKIDPNR